MATVSSATWDQLMHAALAARGRSYAPYSHLQVGASLLAEDGQIVSACNVENASFGLALCAERVAISKAVSEGITRFVALAVATPGSPPGSPCGMCLQVLAEFCDDLELMLFNPGGERQCEKLSRLLPRPFRFAGASSQPGE